MKTKRVLCVVLGFVLSYSACAQDKPDNKPATPPTVPAPVVTQGTVAIAGKQISYSATTGYLQLQDKDGKAKANMFFVAYVKQGESNVKNRPVTYVFNGGPGSASAWLHLGAMGPQKVATTSDGNAVKSPYSLVNNEYSWLDMTDLVFIDPVGCGFSRAIDGEKNDQFYGYDNDIKTVSDFIRLWTNQNNRWGSPKYLAGESYGTTRACGVADYLMEEYSMYFNGIALISCALDFQTLREDYGNDLPYICNVPVYTHAAQYHNVLSQEQNANKDLVKQSEQFAAGEYAAALMQGDALSVDQKMAIAKKLEYFTGVSASVYMDNNLRIPSWKFRKALLDQRNLLIGRYDVRITMNDPQNDRDYASEDPSFTQISGELGTLFNDYVRTDLKYKNDLPFYLIGDVSPWKYGDGKYLNVTDQLRDALFVNPYMKVWLANGTYDLATSYFGTQYAINHMNMPENLRKNITLTYYDGGHMMYFVNSELQKLKQDALKLYMSN